MSTILVTGANRGIGLALVKHFRSRGDAVVAVCRQGSDELAATGARVQTGIDVTDDTALAALDATLGDLQVDQLWLNAGVLERDGLDRLDGKAFDAVRRQFEVNAMGPLRVAHALHHRMGKGSKIAIITSRMGSVADNASGGYYGYRASKAAVNAIGKSLAIDLGPRGIAVYLLHPGYVATDMVGGTGDISPDLAAQRLIARVDSLDQAQTGTFWHSNGSQLTW